MADSVRISIPEEIKKLSGVTNEEFNDKSLQIWVLELYAESKITQSKSAELLNIKVDEFLELFYSKHYKKQTPLTSLEEAEQDFQEALKLK